MYNLSMEKEPGQINKPSAEQKDLSALIDALKPEYIDLPYGLRLLSFECHTELPAKLPRGYGFAGGAARGALLSLLGEQTNPPRDLDVVGISEYNPDPSLQSGISATLMPEDNAHGYGVKIEKLEKYFETRDFRLNEVLVIDDRILCTAEALTDLYQKTIQPTAYEIEHWYSYEDDSRLGIPPKLVMKSLRLQAEMIDQYGTGETTGIDDWQWDIREIPLFYIALALDKCQQISDQTAVNFCRLLLDRGVVAEESISDTNGDTDPDQLALNLMLGMSDMRPVTGFTFQNKELQKRIDRYLAGGTFVDDLYEHYATLANRTGFIRNGEEY